MTTSLSRALLKIYSSCPPVTRRFAITIQGKTRLFSNDPNHIVTVVQLETPPYISNESLYVNSTWHKKPNAGSDETPLQVPIDTQKLRIPSNLRKWIKTLRSTNKASFAIVSAAKHQAATQVAINCNDVALKKRLTALQEECFSRCQRAVATISSKAPSQLATPKARLQLTTPTFWRGVQLPTPSTCAKLQAPSTRYFAKNQAKGVRQDEAVSGTKKRGDFAKSETKDTIRANKGATWADELEAFIHSDPQTDSREFNPAIEAWQLNKRTNQNQLGEVDAASQRHMLHSRLDLRRQYAMRAEVEKRRGFTEKRAAVSSTRLFKMLSTPTRPCSEMIFHPAGPAPFQNDSLFKTDRGRRGVGTVSFTAGISNTEPFRNDWNLKRWRIRKKVTPEVRITAVESFVAKNRSRSRRSNSFKASMHPTKGFTPPVASFLPEEAPMAGPTNEPVPKFLTESVIRNLQRKLLSRQRDKLELETDMSPSRSSAANSVLSLSYRWSGRQKAAKSVLPSVPIAEYPDNTISAPNIVNGKFYSSFAFKHSELKSANTLNHLKQPRPRSQLRRKVQENSIGHELKYILASEARAPPASLRPLLLNPGFKDALSVARSRLARIGKKAPSAVDSIPALLPLYKNSLADLVYAVAQHTDDQILNVRLISKDRAIRKLY